MAVEFHYDDFVVVAHDEWKLRCPIKTSTTEYSAHLGGFEWRVTFAKQRQLTVECMELKEEALTADFHLDWFIYARQNCSEEYKLASRLFGHPNPASTHFKHNNNNNASDLAQASDHCHSFSYSLPECNEIVALNVRFVIAIPTFHNFLVDQSIGHLQNDLKLKVGEQVFHVNKQTLEVKSAYFHRMFNDTKFVEANQDTVDTGETDAALFHDFLHIIHPNIKYTVLPNSQNLTGLMRLAHCYGVDSLSEKFEHSLKFSREIPITERILLAKKYMGKEFDVGSILHGVDNPKELRRICLAMVKADK